MKEMKEILHEELVQIKLELAELEMLKSVAAYEQSYDVAADYRERIKHKLDFVRLIERLIKFEEDENYKGKNNHGLE